MFTDKSKKMISDLKRNHRKQINSLYIRIEAYEKILKLEEKYNLSISAYDFFEPKLSIRYLLKDEESLGYTSNVIFEEIDEILNLEKIEFIDQSEYTNIYLKGMYKGVEVSLCIDFHRSSSCVVKYEDTITKKAVLKCS